MRQLNVVVYSTYLNRVRKTGVEVYAEEMISRLVEKDAHFHLMSVRPTGISRDNVSEILFPERGKFFPLVYDIPKVMKRTQADVFFNPGQYTYFHRTQNSVIVAHDVAWKYFPDYFPLAKRLAFDALMKDVVRRASRIIAVSNTTKSDLVRFFKCDPSRITVVPHGCDLSFFNPEPSFDDEALTRYGLSGRRYILYLGTLQKRKNLINLVKAFELAHMDDTLLVLAGGPGWFSREILDVVDRSPRKSFIRVTGYVPEADKPALYRNCALFAYPSLYEGFGLPVLEAMACGCTVLTTRESAMAEIVEDAEQLVDPNDIDQMSASLRRLTAIADAARRRAVIRAREFTWGKCANSAFEILKEVGLSRD